MSTTNLQQIAEVIRGVSFGRNDAKDAPLPDSVPIIRAGNIQKRLNLSDDLIWVDQSHVNQKQLIQKNDIIMCTSSGSPHIVGKSAIAEKDWHGSFGAFCVGLRAKKSCSPNYLYYFLQSDAFRAWALDSQGVGIKNIRKSELESFEIPLPPLDEQKRIAGILDKADGIRRKRAESLKLLDELLRATFLDMFGDPITNPKGWEYKTAIDFCDCIVPGRDKPKSFTGDTPWVTTSDLNHLGLTAKSRNNLGLSLDEIQQVRARVIPAGSVILTCVGDLGVISIAANEMVINQQLHAFICEDINKWFLMYALSFQKAFMYQRATQTTLPYMNKTACNSIPVFNPPKSLQDRFGEICAKAQSNYAHIANATTESDTLFHSLVARAFKGEL